MRNNPIQIFPRIIFLIVVFIVAIQALQIYFNGGAYFPIDDAYIYYQQAKNLIRGEFFSFSYGGESTNSNTSVLYYLISTLIMYLSQGMSSGLSEQLENIVYLSTILNIIFAAVALIFYQKLVMFFDIEKGNKYWLIFSVFTTAPVIFAYLSGLETGLTLALLLVQLVLFLNKRLALFTIVTVLLSIHRPENIIVNLAYVVIIIPFLADYIDNTDKRKMIVAIAISLMIVPLLNYLLTGDFRSASAARAEFIGPLHIIYNLFHFFSIGFSDPDWIFPEFKPFFAYLRYLISLLITIPLLLIFIKYLQKNKIKLNSLEKFRKHASLHCHYYILLIVLTSYVLVPLVVTGASGEWARYLSPVLPMLYLFIASILKYQKKVLIGVGTINILLLPLYILSYLNMTSIVSSTLHPVAKKISLITKDSDIVSIDSAGLLAHYIKGDVVDVYGLGTTRYMKIHGNFKEVYQQLDKDNLDYAITWHSENPKYYLDSAHYAKALGEDNVEEIYRVKVKVLFDIGEFPSALAIYKIHNKNK